MKNSVFSKQSRQSGFTLVEIAIVLVIIGLILGGVLKGQSLIDNAKYKNFVKQVDSIRAAVLTFQDQYGGLPGDLLNTSALNAAAQAGSGNGLIAGRDCSVAGEESCLVWSHLRYAGLISGDPALNDTAANLTHTFGGTIRGVAFGNWANGVNEHKIMTYTIPGDIAQRYDNEFDDGDPTSGDIARFGGSGTTYTLTTTHNVYITL